MPFEFSTTAKEIPPTPLKKGGFCLWRWQGGDLFTPSEGGFCSYCQKRTFVPSVERGAFVPPLERGARGDLSLWLEKINDSLYKLSDRLFPTAFLTS
ncbi:hypothetical protein C7B80_28900 [Cyanosarcina cf. burmensis CCALA 770]|nr:hypothetical protein C7B80_28900 [Cyanosarcina cf. burmensis CCALA 770]